MILDVPVLDDYCVQAKFHSLQTYMKKSVHRIPILNHCQMHLIYACLTHECYNYLGQQNHQRLLTE